MTKTVLVLGTGGTIAGLRTGEHRYEAAKVGVAALLPSAVNREFAQQDVALQFEQLAQFDSRDLRLAFWQALHARVVAALLDMTIAGIVITHGTDTLEETAFFLYLCARASKPIVLTGAMRPADAQGSDGVANLTQAIGQAASGPSAVLVCWGGAVFPAHNVYKAHPTRPLAFAQRVICSRGADALWLQAQAGRFQEKVHRSAVWPRVAIVHNAAGADGADVLALQAAGFEGFVVAATGDATVSEALQAVLLQVSSKGCAVVLTSRCLEGNAQPNPQSPFVIVPLTPVAARVWLMVQGLRG